MAPGKNLGCYVHESNLSQMNDFHLRLLGRDSANLLDYVWLLVRASLLDGCHYDRVTHWIQRQSHNIASKGSNDKILDLFWGCFKNPIDDVVAKLVTRQCDNMVLQLVENVIKEVTIDQMS